MKNFLTISKHSVRWGVILGLGMALQARSADAFTGDTNAQAAQRGINEVTADAVSFGQSQGCVACHRQGASLYGLAHSNASGFTVDLSDTTGIGVLASEIANDQYPGGYWLHAASQYPNAKGSYAMFGLAGYDAYV